MQKLIDSLHLPQDLRNLSTTELETVAHELREELIDKVSQCGGHFASSLGAAEITVALHAMFKTPHDRLVWDVGHQGYIHKMVTGRRGGVASIRQRGGISGFLKRKESEFDTFGAGHAGTSISAGVGMSIGLNKAGSDRYVVAVIGDGSMTAGMAFEALNHAGSLGLRNFIVLLNDNEMSISPNVGAISWLFSKAVTSKTSTIARTRFKNLHRKGYVPDFVYRWLDRAEEAAQGFFAGAAMLFEAFGFRYIGPVDGHNMGDLLKAMEHAKQQDVPVLIHAYTTKGKGFEPAEVDPLKWHATKPFDRGKISTEVKTSPAKSIPSYTGVFADAFVQLAQRDPKLIGITAAMSTGTGLNKLESTLPEQFIDVGICEQHAVTCAAGLACEGFRPVCAIYSTFLQRAYDQVIHDVCIQDLPVVFAMDRAGAVGNDGETHQGAFDISYLRTIPNLTLMAPKDENELRNMLYSALHYGGPVALRYPRGNGIGVPLGTDFELLEIGKAELLEQGEDVLFLCYGPVTYHALQVCERLHQQHGIRATVVNARFAKPLDDELLCECIRSHSLICTVEDHSLMGGFGSAVLELIHERNLHIEQTVKMFGISDAFVPHASQAEQYAMYGYDVEGIFRSIVNTLGLAPLQVVGY